MQTNNRLPETAAVTAFLSYSGSDRHAVNRLKDRLQEAGVETWIDHTEIKGGDNFLGSIVSALKKADFVLVWWTAQAAASNFVGFEFNRAMLDEVEQGETRLIFCRADDTDVPEIGRHKHYIDFRQNYEEGLRNLCATIGVSSGGTMGRVSPDIRNRVERLLEDLRSSHVCVFVRDVCQIEIIYELERLPRTGKLVRFERDAFPFPLRSVFDHVLSIAHTSDHLLEALDHGIDEKHFPDLAATIAYHDLGEVLLGDVPSHTALTDYSERLRQNRPGDGMLLSNRDSNHKKRQDKVANSYIDLFLDQKHLQFAKRRDAVLGAEKCLGEVRDFFIIADQLDAIIAVWRYIHLFRPTVMERCDVFLKAMTDFFDNPEVVKLAERYRDRRLGGLARGLLDVGNARRFVDDPDVAMKRLATSSKIAFPIVNALLLGHLPRYVPPVS